VLLYCSSIRLRVKLELIGDLIDCRVKAAIPIGKKPVVEEEKKGQ
jgi:hypothetical protein